MSDSESDLFFFCDESTYAHVCNNNEAFRYHRFFHQVPVLEILDKGDNREYTRFRGISCVFVREDF